MTTEHSYTQPDTSDKRDDETWTAYWDRKRRERHGENCECVLCANESYIAAISLPLELRTGEEAE